MSETSVPDRASVTPAPAKISPRRERSEVALLLLLGAVDEDRVADEAAREGQRAGDDVAVPRDLLHQGGVRDVVETGAAVLDRDDAAGEAERAGLLHELLREALGLVVLGHAGGDLALRPLSRELDQLALLLVEPELHVAQIVRNQPIVW